MAQVGLLSTDFDGTLVEAASDWRCSKAFGEVLRHLHENGGIWAINTGRSLPDLIEGMACFKAPFQPDFVVTQERELYQRRGDHDWHPVGDWNRICLERHQQLYDECGEIWDKLRSLTRSREDVMFIEDHPYPEGLMTSDERIMDEICGILDQWKQETQQGLAYQRNVRYLRFCHEEYHKGSALEELARMVRVSPEETMAAGDQFNDMSMLDGRVAKLCCCPSNAIEEVQALVQSSGGYVASQTSSEGVAEAYEWFT